VRDAGESQESNADAESQRVPFTMRDSSVAAVRGLVLCVPAL
jgi:hypothetical protein